MGKQFDIDYLSKEIANEMNFAKKWIAKRTAKKMRNKLIKVYDSLIDQFYKYKTEVYIRHDLEEPKVGTETGVNLYRSMQSHAGEPPKLQPSPNAIFGGVLINSEDMNGTNYNVSKDIVLDNILKGIRFPGTKKMPKMTFTLSYEDSECSATGTPIEILESIRDQLASKYADEAKEEAKKELKLKYVEIN